MERLVTAREEAGFPFIITSGYRCVAYNESIGGKPNSGHVLGLAADIAVYGFKALEVIRLGVKHGMTGVGVSQKGDLGSRFVHLDSMENSEGVERPNIWSY